MRILMILALLVFAGCSDDTSSTEACSDGQAYNPITRACETPVMNAPDVSFANDVSATDDAGDTTTPCTDCGPFFFDPDRLAFTFTPARESTSIDVDLSFLGDTASQVESIEFEGSNEFQLVNLRVGDLISLGRRVVTVQYSPTDNTPDAATIRVHLQNTTVGFAELNLSSTITGTDVCQADCPRIQVDPASISISFQPGDAPTTRPILVGNVGQGPLEVREVLVLQQGRA
ncbi:MAG: hypothetical protein R3E66_24930 [bacterium]